MPRNLDPNLITETEKKVVSPAYLLFIDFSVPAYLSNFGTINYNSQIWIKANFNASNISDTGFRVSIDNTDRLESASVLSTPPNDVEMQLYEYHNGFATEIIRGWISGISITQNQVNYDVSGSRSEIKRVPDIYFDPPAFNYLPIPGSIILWNNLKIVLQSND